MEKMQGRKRIFEKKNMKTLSSCFKSSEENPRVRPDNPRNPPQRNHAQQIPGNNRNQRQQQRSEPSNRNNERRDQQQRDSHENRQEGIPEQQPIPGSQPNQNQKKKTRALQILTNINEENLIVAETKPSPQTLKHVKYLCPICFRYFNKILQFFDF